MKVKRIFGCFIVVLFCAIIVAVPILTKLEEYRVYSIFENKNLALPPVFSAEGLFNNEYLPSWDVYLGDHIYRRDDILALKTFLDLRIAKRPVLNGVVIQEDLLLPFHNYNSIPDHAEISEQAETMASDLYDLERFINDNGGEFLYLGVPQQYSILRDSYPGNFNSNAETLELTESAFFASLEKYGIDYIDMMSEFLETDDFEKYYCRTDHHYNLFGAFFTYQKLIAEMNAAFDANLPVMGEADIEFITIKNPYYGSHSRKLYNLYDVNEKLHYFIEKEPLPCIVANNGNTDPGTVFRLPDNENSPVTGQVYMGGEMGEVVISTNREELPDILLFGDSFAVRLRPFLYHSFNETRVLDLRYYTGMTLWEYIELHRPDYVVCIRNDTVYLSFVGNGDLTPP